MRAFFEKEGNMKLVSETVGKIQPSLIRKMLALQSQIPDVISFSIGEPDFRTPKNIEDAAVKALREGKTKYAPNWGIPELREAIAQTLQRSHQVSYDPNGEILVTSCGMDNLRLASLAALNIGDELLIPSPYFTNYPNHPLLANATPIFIPLHEQDGFMLQASELEKFITPKTKAILLNSPSNPTGAVISFEALKKVCEFAIKHDLLVISDEVYQHIIYDGLKFYSPAMIKGMKERTLVCNSFSKSYAMTGWRLGYVAGPRELIAAMHRIHESTIASVTTFVQYAGVEALTGTQEPMKEMVAEFETRRNLICDYLNQIPNLSCIRPQGAFYAFVNIKKTGLNSEEFAYKLLEQQHVSVVPGNGFGEAGEGYVRISYATSREQIKLGMERISVFAKQFE